MADLGFCYPISLRLQKENYVYHDEDTPIFEAIVDFVLYSTHIGFTLLCQLFRSTRFVCNSPLSGISIDSHD